MMNILLPTDFSDNSRNAAVYAMHFFQDIPCTFHLLHVSHSMTNSHSAISPEIPLEIQQKFEKLLLRLKEFQKNPLHRFKTICKFHFFIETVREQVLEKKIDLIIMGTKGAHKKENAVVGKNTSDVMMKVKCPVLAISENAVFKGPREILFPTDFKIKFGGKMLSSLFQLLSLSQASVKILEIYNSEQEPSEEQKLNKLLLTHAFSHNLPLLETYYRSNTKRNGRILNLNEKTDMIVLAAKNLNICQKLLNNQPENQIPFVNQLPLLVLH